MCFFALPFYAVLNVMKEPSPLRDIQARIFAPGRGSLEILWSRAWACAYIHIPISYGICAHVNRRVSSMWALVEAKRLARIMLKFKCHLTNSLRYINYLLRSTRFCNNIIKHRETLFYVRDRFAFIARFFSLGRINYLIIWSPRFNNKFNFCNRQIQLSLGSVLKKVKNSHNEGHTQDKHDDATTFRRTVYLW